MDEPVGLEDGRVVARVKRLGKSWESRGRGDRLRWLFPLLRGIVRRARGRVVDAHLDHPPRLMDCDWSVIDLDRTERAQSGVASQLILSSLAAQLRLESRVDTSTLDIGSESRPPSLLPGLRALPFLDLGPALPCR